jgi:hypothetical protein
LVFPQAPGKSGLKPAFSLESRVAVPKLKFWNSLAGQSFLSGGFPANCGFGKDREE